MVEVANLKQTIRDQTAAMRELIEERDTAQDRADRTGWGTPAPEGKHTKSTKLPDGQVLVDGKDPKFESWLIDVEGKLEANADHYPTAQARMAYVKSMCKGEAANHLLARMRKDSPDRYHDVDDIFDHLRTLYQDANRVINAKMELRRLMMRDTKFQPFLSQFVLLAQDAGLAASEWKEDLFYKLSFELQRAMIKESNDPRVSYQEFVKECSTTANRLEQINTSEKRARPRKTDTYPRPGESYPNPATPKAKNGSEGLPWLERKKLMEENKCFNCKLPGHRAFDCPLKKKAPELKNLEEVSPPESQSENDHA